MDPAVATRQSARGAIPLAHRTWRRDANDGSHHPDSLPEPHLGWITAVVAQTVRSGGPLTLILARDISTQMQQERSDWHLAMRSCNTRAYRAESKTAHEPTMHREALFTRPDH